MKGVHVTVTGESLATNAAAAAQLGMIAAARVVRDAVVAVFGTNHGGVPSTPGMPPNSQTNNLRQSWEIDKVNPSVYSEVPYASHLETGAIVRPRNKKAIVIPVSQEAVKLLKRSMGTPWVAIAALRHANPKRFRKIPTDNGVLIGLGQARKSQRWFTPYFLVTRKATIAARPYVDKSINDAGPNVEEAFIDAALPVLIGGRA